MGFVGDAFSERQYEEEPRHNDWRTPYNRDRARIIHGAAFRRLQGKTQVMGAGEGDFHRTRMTHTLEVAQIGLGLFSGLKCRDTVVVPEDLKGFLHYSRPIVSASCYAHDLGHPPFGHGGERALHAKLYDEGGFEGNAQTIRLLTKLEKYTDGRGINPTRRMLLSVLKYPVDYDDYIVSDRNDRKPPKCYYHDQRGAIDWALCVFSDRDQEVYRELSSGEKRKPIHKSFDASIMECADDIAYSTHDLEDIVARGLVLERDLMEELNVFFSETPEIKVCGEVLKLDYFIDLFRGGRARKRFIGGLVNMLMNATTLESVSVFEHPLLKYRLGIVPEAQEFVKFLKKNITYNMVVGKPEVQMLEMRGQRVVGKLFDEFMINPEQLIPHWKEMDNHDSVKRRVADYIAGMTDSFAEKIYNRMFTPGFGSSRDEL